MKYVFLDTCIYVACSLINKEGARPELLVALSDSIKRAGSQLLMPEVVLHEYRRSVDRELSRLATDIERFTGGGNTLAASEDQRKLNEFLAKLRRDREKAAALARGFVEQLPDDPSSVRSLSLTPEVLTAATLISLRGAKPSWRAKAVEDDSRTAARGLVEVDCLIVSTLADFARSAELGEGDLLLFCTDNRKDFALMDQERQAPAIHPDIRSLFACPVRYYARLEDLLVEEFDAKVPEQDDVRDMERALETMRRDRVHQGILLERSAIDEELRRIADEAEIIDGRLAGARAIVDMVDVDDVGEQDDLAGEIRQHTESLAALEFRQRELLARRAFLNQRIHGRTRPRNVHDDWPDPPANRV